MPLYAKVGTCVHVKSTLVTHGGKSVSLAYRIYFWHQQAGQRESGWVSDEWEIDDADVNAVLDWADHHADGRTFTLYAAVTDSDGLGLIRLLGHDPTSGG